MPGFEAGDVSRKGLRLECRLNGIAQNKLHHLIFHVLAHATFLSTNQIEANSKVHRMEGLGWG